MSTSGKRYHRTKQEIRIIVIVGTVLTLTPFAIIGMYFDQIIDFAELIILSF